MYSALDGKGWSDVGSEQRGQLAAQTQGALCVFIRSSDGEDKAPKSTSMHISIKRDIADSVQTQTSSSSPRGVGPDAPVGTGIHWNCVHISHRPVLGFQICRESVLSFVNRRRRRPSLTRTVSAPQPYGIVLKLLFILFFFLPEFCRGDASPHLGVLLFKVPFACYGW